MSHNHKVENYNQIFAIGIILNIIFVVVEATYGILSGSLALLADAGHNLSDVLSLLIAWGATFLAKKAVTTNRTYGFRKVTIMASTISAILLLVALGGIIWEAIGRFSNPQPVESSTLIIVAAIGVVINTITALLFVSGHKHDLNIKGAFLHMAADAAISLGVVIAGLLIMQTNWLIIDPIISIIIVIIILIGTWSLLRDSVNLLIDAVPDGIDITAIKEYLSNLKSVNEIHDLHIWALSTTETALTVHLVVTENLIRNDFLEQIQKHLHDHFDIEHATIQIEKLADFNMGYDPKCH
jgi:cobalt-zinc-cadmium efflux system protein